MATKAQGNDCYEKAAPYEPVFTLLARDLTAGMVVRLWAKAQRYVRWEMQNGMTQERALHELEQRLDSLILLPSSKLAPSTPKEQEAYLCADHMDDWSTRKLPD